MRLKTSLTLSLAIAATSALYSLPAQANGLTVALRALGKQIPTGPITHAFSKTGDDVLEPLLKKAGVTARQLEEANGNPTAFITDLLDRNPDLLMGLKRNAPGLEVVNGVVEDVTMKILIGVDPKKSSVIAAENAEQLAARVKKIDGVMILDKEGKGQKLNLDADTKAKLNEQCQFDPKACLEILAFFDNGGRITNGKKFQGELSQRIIARNAILDLATTNGRMDIAGLYKLLGLVNDSPDELIAIINEANVLADSLGMRGIEAFNQALEQRVARLKAMYPNKAAEYDEALNQLRINKCFEGICKV